MLNIRAISVIHVLVGIALLVYLNSSRFRPFESTAVKLAVALLGFAVMGYHIYKYRQTGGKWIYLFHALIVAPVIIYFGVCPVDARAKLQLVAVAMMAYHLAIMTRVL